MMGDLNAAGVRMVTGSDAGINPGKAHGILPEAVAGLVLGGVSPTDALTTTTSLAAAACGLANQTGRITPGYTADLLLVTGDPTTDITALHNIQAIYLRGTRV
jgi:imidazolonepropionase-like amidohydrolase